jgi:outer membrane receptor protein involved in Fe transport
MKLKNFTFILLCILSSVAAYAQTGIIRGSIIDEEAGEPLIGATAQITGSSIGAVTDMDGKFSLNNVAAGTYTVQLSYLGYQTKQIENVVVKAGEVTVIEHGLKSESTALSEVIVTAEAVKNNDIAMLSLQRKSSLVLDGISAKQFSMNGDNDAAAAIKRVTGVSVEGGKYVYVRGLGDRYSKTTLNKSEIPGLDPNRNTVQMDLFPSNLIDNLTVYKTFSPEIPGNFTGGYVNITTKDFPDQFTVQFSASAGYNTNATFTEGVITDDWGKNHWLGFSDKNRELPRRIKDGVTPRSFSTGQAIMLDKETKSFQGSMNPSSYSPSMNHSFSFSIGDQKELLGKQIGFIAGLSYQRTYEYYQNGDLGRFFLPGDVTAASLDTLYNLKDVRGKESVLWGALLNTTVKLSNNHKIGVNLMHNQSADASARFLEGTFPFASGNDPNFQIQLRGLEYVERSLSTGQIKGDHVLGARKIKVEWIGAYASSAQKEPDLKYFNNLRFGSGPEYTYDAISNNIRPASRYFRDMEESNIDGKLNLEIPFRSGSTESKIKVGGSYVTKEREFNETIIQYKPELYTKPYNGNIEEYFSESNLGLVGPSNEIQYGLIIQDQTTGGGTYNGKENVPAAYAMVDWQITRSFRLSTGVRYEKTDIEVENKNAKEAERLANLENNDLLPALNVTKQIGDKSNLRFAYGRTIARPTFRELARFASFDFQGDFIQIGNPFLKRTVIDNIDVRYEMFPQSGELISVSAFYKNFQDPIERAVDPNTNDLATQVVYRNVDKAWLSGVELEFRKRLDFISPRLSNFTAGVNFAYIYSQVDISEGELKLIRNNDPGASSKRVMFGQSPYIVNAIFGYDNAEKRINANINFNVQGERLSVVSTGGIPNVFEQPRPVLDFNLKKGIARKWSMKVSATNLLDSRYRMTHEFNGKEYNYSSYRLGRNYSVGLSFLIE